MYFFNDSVLRLKQQLKIQSDKEAAEALGLSPAAFNNRKKRGNFPAKEVFALAAQRPELCLDPDWIVTGSSKKMETEGDAEGSLIQCYRIMSKHDQGMLVKIAIAMSGVTDLSGEEINRRLANYKP